MTRDLVGYVDAHYRTVADRSARAVGGYSMGGSGALRYVLAHQDEFSAALILSPATYTPLPPRDSSARDYGAFGVGHRLFDAATYQKLNYPRLLKRVDPSLPIHLFIAVGDDEYVNPNPVDATHDLDFESAVLYNAAKRVPGITAEFRELNGGHDWDVWQPAFVEGVQDLFHYVSSTPPVPLTGALLGTAGDDRAGGVVPDASGATTVALAAAGASDGQPYAGGLDAVVTHRSASGDTTWTREFGTSADERLYGAVSDGAGGVYVAGYTNGNLDGAHAQNSSGDAIVARIAADGTTTWLRELGDPAQADRAYALAADPSGGVVVAGYTKGSPAAPNAGDKDILVARLDGSGALSWQTQFGGPGEDKALALAVGADGSAYVAGVTSDAMPGAASNGGLDGWIARLDTTGQRAWLDQVGTDGDDQLAGLAATADGVVATGDTTGTLGGENAGGHDVVLLDVASDGTVRFTQQAGTVADDRGADVAVRPDGRIEVAAYTNGRFGGSSGGVDLAMLRFAADGTPQGAVQFGTSGADGGDPFDEENLYLGQAGDELWLTGLTTGSLPGTTNQGLGDVFVTHLDPASDLPG